MTAIKKINGIPRKCSTLETSFRRMEN